ncbi:MAG: carbohydrate ABC transporter permease [Anaerolineae bacterium]
MASNSLPINRVLGDKALPSTRRRRSGLGRIETRDGWLMALPFLIGVAAFWAGPMLYSLFIITQQWNLITPPKPIGLGNLQQLMADPLVGIALWNTAYYTFLGVPLRLVAAFALALALNQPLRGRALLRAIFYVPAIVPAVANSVVWLQLLNPEYGLVNAILRSLGLPAVAWLYEPMAAKPAFIFMSLWGIGPQMIIFLAALQDTPREMLEAAEIDGAGVWARFAHVTVPVVSPVILFNLTMGIIGSFQVFTSALVMTRGGPQNATLFMVLYIYDTAFTLFRMGYSAALAWLLFLIIMAVTFVQLRITNRWVYYETV